MKQLLKEFISYILEVETAAQQAKKAGYKSLGGGYWSKSGDKPAEATTRGGQFRKLTAQEKKKLAQADAGQKPTPTQEPKEVPTTMPVTQDTNSNTHSLCTYFPIYKPLEYLLY